MVGSHLNKKSIWFWSTRMFLPF